MRKARDERIIALNLGPDAEPTPEIAAYFEKCREKLGFVPNVLRAYAFNNTKLKAFIDMVDDLMLGDSGLSKLEREMIAVAVSSVNHCHYCLTAHGATRSWRRPTPWKACLWRWAASTVCWRPWSGWWLSTAQAGAWSIS